MNKGNQLVRNNVPLFFRQDNVKSVVHCTMKVFEPFTSDVNRIFVCATSTMKWECYLSHCNMILEGFYRLQWGIKRMKNRNNIIDTDSIIRVMYI